MSDKQPNPWMDFLKPVVVGLVALILPMATCESRNFIVAVLTVFGLPTMAFNWGCVCFV